MICKIYRIVPKEGGEIGDVYYGSSIQQYLCKRFATHKWRYRTINDYSSGIIFAKYGEDNCKMELVEEFEGTLEQMHEKERDYIKNNPCVNKYIPLQSEETKKQKHKESNVKWYADIQADPERKQAHAKHLHEYHLTRYETLKNDPEYKHKKAERAKKAAQTEYKCDCGSTVSMGTKNRHFKSEKHQAYMKGLSTIISPLTI